MLEVDKRKNCSNLDEFGIKTNQGEFIVSKEQNDGLYIGFVENNPETNIPYEFRITKENYQVYRIFLNLYSRLSFIKGKRSSSVKILSEDFDNKEASSLTIRNNKETDDLSLIFEKSKSDRWRNTYFVRFANLDNISELDFNLFEKFFDELSSYSPKHRQMDIEEYLYNLKLEDKKQKQRTRGMVSSIQK